MAPHPRPLIAITPRSEARTSGEPALFAQQCLVDAVVAAGGIPVVLGAPCPKDDLGQLVGAFDGFLVPGGLDIDPAHYGQQPHEACGPTSELRDELECALIPLVVAADKPLLGICRGCQAINVALGGTLWQDLPSQPEATPSWEEPPLRHRQGEPYEEPVHTVAVTPGSLLASALGRAPEHLGVNSLHHQSVRVAAPGLAMSAWAPDGVVEAVEKPSARFVLGVQWHPEFLWRADPAAFALFEALVRAAGDGAV